MLIGFSSKYRYILCVYTISSNAFPANPVNFRKLLWYLKHFFLIVKLSNCRLGGYCIPFIVFLNDHKKQVIKLEC